MLFSSKKGEMPEKRTSPLFFSKNVLIFVRPGFLKNPRAHKILGPLEKAFIENAFDFEIPSPMVLANFYHLIRWCSYWGNV